jgi:hypothetical protein
MSNDQTFSNRTNSPDRKTRPTKERADFVSFAVAPQGKVQQSMYESKWAAYQPWAVEERPDRNYGPALTPEARRLLESERNHANRD